MISFYLPFINASLLIIPIILGLIFFYKLDTSFKAFLFYFIYRLAAEIYSYYTSNPGANNLFFLHLYYFIEGNVFFIIFIQYLNQYKKYLMANLILFCICSICFPLLMNGNFNEMNSIPRVIGNICLAIWSVFAFISLADDLLKNPRPVLQESYFWLFLGIIFYFSGSSIFIGLLSNHAPNYIWSTNLLLQSITTIIFSISFLCHKFKPHKY